MTPSNPHLPAAPDQIAAAEELGRSLFSRRRGYRAFLENSDARMLSVDRLTYAPPDFAVANADKMALMRNRTFYGWLVITAGRSIADGFRIQASPLPDGSNPYHADIILPESAVANRDERVRCAQMLADAAQWHPRP